MIREWIARTFGIAEGPRGPMGFPGPQGNSGMVYVVIVDKDGSRLISREEFERVFGALETTAYG